MSLIISSSVAGLNESMNAGSYGGMSLGDFVVIVHLVTNVLWRALILLSKNCAKVSGNDSAAMFEGRDEAGLRWSMSLMVRQRRLGFEMLSEICLQLNAFLALIISRW